MGTTKTLNPFKSTNPEDKIDSLFVMLQKFFKEADKNIERSKLLHQLGVEDVLTRFIKSLVTGDSGKSEAAYEFLNKIFEGIFEEDSDKIEKAYRLNTNEELFYLLYLKKNTLSNRSRYNHFLIGLEQMGWFEMVPVFIQFFDKDSGIEVGTAFQQIKI